MKKLVLLIAVLLIAAVNITGCASIEYGIQKPIQAVEKTLYDDSANESVKEEPVSYKIVYDRYIYPVYHLDGWDIRDLCKKTHTEMNVL